MGYVPPDVTEIVRRYVEALRRLGVIPTRVLLFGSHARGQAGPWSDIDLLIVSPDFDRITPPERPRILARANRDLLAPIQALWATPEALEAATPASFLRAILDEGRDIETAR
jgi:predicted nucleotidyltransferase